MWWELDADKDRGRESLVEIARGQWGELDRKENDLDYPMSSEHSPFASLLPSLTQNTRTYEKGWSRE